MVRIVVLYLRQDDPKKNTALRLEKFGLVEIVHDPRDAPRGALILDPFATQAVSPNDREVVERRGILAVDCSWAKSIQTFRRVSRHLRGVRRRLPFLVSANPSHYGKPYMLTTAEAIAAALYITGYRELAEQILSVFKWGPEFLRINKERLDAYAEGRLDIEQQYFTFSQDDVMRLLREYHGVD